MENRVTGAILSGFLESAREILVRGDKEACIWHIPGGVANHYNGSYGGIKLSGYGKNDLRIDNDPKVKPDILFDVRHLDKVTLWQDPGGNGEVRVLHALFNSFTGALNKPEAFDCPDAIIIDRDYSEADAQNRDDPSTWPADLNELTRQCLRIVKPGHYVGVLDLISPRLGKEYLKCYQIPVLLPDGARPRLFTVWRTI